MLKTSTSVFRFRGCLDEGSARFYTACVTEALTFLHSRGVVYRDVKPENVVLDEHGYGKLVLQLVTNLTPHCVYWIAAKLTGNAWISR